MKTPSICEAAAAATGAKRPGSSLPRVRLDYLDGLRALAALTVAFTHAYTESGWHVGRETWRYLVLVAIQWMSHGRAAVAVFIVLSGYCLMLPVARSAGAALSGGVPGYLRRRAWRILPPYYAALALCLCLIFAVPSLGRPRGVEWDNALPAFTPGAVLSHLLLVHNLNADWILKIDPPLWSVATEWQIYFLFPFLLLPVWKRFGNTSAVLIGFVAGLSPWFLLGRGTGAAPWFLGLFALGMTGACISFPSRRIERVLRDRAPWGLLCTALFLVYAALRLLHNIPRFDALTGGKYNWFWPDYIWPMDALVGAITVCLLIFCTRWLTQDDDSRGETASRAVRRSPLVLRVLEARWPVRLGVFSYSIYLVHFPALALLHVPLRVAGASTGLALAVLMLVGLPFSIFVAYVFHLLFERKFMERRPSVPATGDGNAPR